MSAKRGTKRVAKADDNYSDKFKTIEDQSWIYDLFWTGYINKFKRNWIPMDIQRICHLFLEQIAKEIVTNLSNEIDTKIVPKIYTLTDCTLPEKRYGLLAIQKDIKYASISINKTFVELAIFERQILYKQSLL